MLLVSCENLQRGGFKQKFPSLRKTVWTKSNQLKEG
jgi:hypothetical protein